MILLMQNLQTSCYSIFNGEPQKFSLGETILIFFVFFVFDCPLAYFVIVDRVLLTCEYIKWVFALLFLVLSISTIRVIKSINKLETVVIGDLKSLRSQKLTLFSVLIIFDLTYLARMICSATIF